LPWGVFDEVAQPHDGSCPRFPEALVDELVLRSGLGPASTVLEVGADGGGLAAALARTGCRITVIEPSPAPAAAARRDLAPFPRADAEVTAFEHWSLPAASYCLLVSTTAFHRSGPGGDLGARIAKAAAALRPGGTLALVTSHHVEGGSSGFFTGERRCHERWSPASTSGGTPWAQASTPGGTPLPAEDAVATDTRELTGSPLFGPVSARRYAHEITLSTAQYTHLLRSRPGCRDLAPDVRRGLLDCVAELAESRYGGRVTMRCLHELITAVRTDEGAPALPGGSGGEEGGETACLLHRVCPECGRFAETPGAGRCALCGAAFPAR
jgi:SAM-dependent methyltransferase